MAKASLWVAAAFLVLFPAWTASAAVISVATTGDDVTGDGSPGAPYRTIQKGLDMAQLHDSVEVAPGTYAENVVFPHIAVTLTGTDPENPAVVAATIIDGGGGSVLSMSSIRNSNPDPLAEGVFVKGITLTNGHADVGGGILCWACDLTVYKCVIEGNTANCGGGMYTYGGNAKVWSCTFASNTASMGGGGMYIDGCNAEVLSCIFTGNSASMGGGAACDSSYMAGIFTGCSFSQNHATSRGGAICGDLYSVEYCTFDRNTSGGEGGAICAYPRSYGVAHSTFTRNEAVSGGAIAVIQGETDAAGERPCVGANSITGNFASSHGGGLFVDVDKAECVIAGSVVAGNRAGADGGGIFVRTCGGLEAESCTIDRNLAPAGAGGGIAIGKGVFGVVKGCIIRDNAAGQGDQLAAESGKSRVVVSYSDMLGTRLAAYDPGGAFLWRGGVMDVDPLFASPGSWDDNGTPDDYSDDSWNDGDYHLKSMTGRWDPSAAGGAGDWVIDAVYSPCIDAGDPREYWYYYEPEPNGYRGNMGAYGGSGFASKSAPLPDTGIVAMSVASSHRKIPIEAVWPDADCPPTFFSVVLLDWWWTYTFFTEVSADPAMPKGAGKLVSSTRRGHYPSSLTLSRSEWKRVRKMASAVGGGPLYWRIRGVVGGQTVYTSEVKTFEVDGGEWALGALDLSAPAPEVTWTHTGEGIVKYRVQFSVDENFPPSARYTLTLPPSRTGSSYTLSAAMARRLLAFASRNGVTTLYYRVRGEDADRTFVAYSPSKTATVP